MGLSPLFIQESLTATNNRVAAAAADDAWLLINLCHATSPAGACFSHIPICGSNAAATAAAATARVFTLTVRWIFRPKFSSQLFAQSLFLFVILRFVSNFYPLIFIGLKIYLYVFALAFNYLQTLPRKI